MISKKENTLWVEKYRPFSLENYVGNFVFKSSIEKYLRKNDIPHMIFYGAPGKGKTTAAKLIVNNLNCEHLYLNGSDENGIDIVRTKIKDFASAASFKPLKVVIFDDCSTLTNEAQQGLLNMVESFSKNTRFIFTTNHLDKIIPALQSRCIQFQIEPPSRKDVTIHIANILDKEEVVYEPFDVANMVKKYYPDIRKCVSIAQECSEENKFTLNFDLSRDNSYLCVMLEELSAPTKNSWSTIRKSILASGVTDYSDGYRFLYDNAEKISADKYADIIIAVAQSQYQSTTVPDKEICFSSMILQIINLLK